MSKSHQVYEYSNVSMLAVDDLTQGTTRLKSLMAIKCMSFFLFDMGKWVITWGKILVSEILAYEYVCRFEGCAGENARLPACTLPDHGILLNTTFSFDPHMRSAFTYTYSFGLA